MPLPADAPPPTPRRPAPRRGAPWRAAATLLAAWAATATAAPVWQAGLQLSSDRHCDALPLADLGRRQDVLARVDPRQGRNLCYVEDEVRLTVRHEGWDWGLLARQSASLVAHAQALDLARRAEQGQAPDADQHWRTNARFRQMTGGGLALGRRLQEGPWQVRLAAQGLSLHRWRERELSGTAGYDADTGRYSLDMGASRTDNGLRFPFQGPVAPLGHAVLLQAGLDWTQEAWRASVALQDLGWLRWRGLPEQRMRLDSDTTRVDENGFVQYGPLVSGRYAQSDRTVFRRGRWRVALAGALPGGGWAGIEAQELPGWGWLTALDWRQPLAAGLDGRLSWQHHQRRLVVGLGRSGGEAGTATGTASGWQLQYGADRLGGPVRSRLWGLSWLQAW
ncbi:hypothetical protein [Ideonella livida]|uniref:ShlB/FhaC/HecB family hemolysin secretion/activation protein n=1 Tax=Ideonella livida TaxID=2707176 RepID=A0A7C9PIN9_9BURK|nr:hypothetical protein [Ideonella livida]NDY92995.1 hypothetical protein [Ideonella livida]